MSALQRRRERVGVAAVALSAVCFGSLAIFGKLGERAGIGVAELLGLRFGIAAVVLWALVVATGAPRWNGRRTPGLWVMGLLYVGQSAAFFTSLRFVPAAVTSMLLYLYPGVVMVLARLLLGDVMGRKRLAALAMATAGAVLVVNPSPSAHVALPGVLFGVLCALVYSVYIVAGERLVAGAPALTAMAWVASAAGVTFLAAAAVTGQLHPPSGTSLAAALGLALLPTTVAATLFLAGLERVGATRAAIISTLEPVTTTLLAGLVLGESLAPVQALGGILVLSAAVVVARGGRPTALHE